MFLGNGEPIDALVVGECLVIRRNQAHHIQVAALFQHRDTQVRESATRVRSVTRCEARSRPRFGVSTKPVQLQTARGQPFCAKVRLGGFAGSPGDRHNCAAKGSS